MEDQTKPAPDAPPAAESSRSEPQPSKEVGGRNGPEPTRYGDWEKGGIAVDF